VPNSYLLPAKARERKHIVNRKGHRRESCTGTGKYRNTKPDKPRDSDQGFNYPSTFSGAKQREMLLGLISSKGKLLID